MVKRLLILLLAMMLILSGCSGPSEQSTGFPSSESEVAVLQAAEAADGNVLDPELQLGLAQQGSDTAAASEERPAKKVNDLVNDEVNDSARETVTAEDEKTVSQTEAQRQAESNSDPQTESEDSTSPVTNSSESDVVEREESPETTEETVPEESADPESESEPSQEETVPAEDTVQETETETDPGPEFDINYWISYAQDLARSKGLILEASATDCWDNPITANAGCIYLERDLNARLDRYAADEDITDVWIWYEEQGNGRYLIYIGYA